MSFPHESTKQDIYQNKTEHTSPKVTWTGGGTFSLFAITNITPWCAIIVVCDTPIKLCPIEGEGEFTITNFN